MKTTAEILVLTLMLALIHFSSPVSSASHPAQTVVSNNAGVLLMADGTDPMPTRRR
jgi:hypothetical protein